MILGIGIDSLKIGRMERALRRENFWKRVFTEEEQIYLKERTLSAQSAAGMFCAKEAVLKALSLGIADTALTNIEVLHKQSGAPYIVLHGRLKRDVMIHISITHTEDTANAFAVLEEEETKQ